MNEAFKKIQEIIVNIFNNEPKLMSCKNAF